MIATCTHCGTGWELDDDQPTCPGCRATSYTVPREDLMEAWGSSYAAFAADWDHPDMEAYDRL